MFKNTGSQFVRLMCYYALQGRLKATFRNYPLPMGSPETSVLKRLTSCYNPDDGRIEINRGGNL